MKTNRKPNRGAKHNGNSRGNGDKIAKYILVAVVALLVLWAVKAVYDKFFGKEIKTDSQPTLVSPVQPDGSGVKAVIVLDCSSSMKGYANAYPNNYLDVLSDLLSLYPNTNALINGDMVKGQDLIDKIRNHEFEYTQQSLIDQDLANWADKVQESHNPKKSTASKNKTTTNGAAKPLYFYITDGIMSGSDAQIRRDPEYNRIHAQNLKNQIIKAFQGKEQVGVSVYQFKSHFKGEYWAYDNEHHLVNSERYFYIFAVGPRSVLADLKQKVDSKRNQTGFCFHPLAQWHAIDTAVISSGLNVGPVGAVNVNSGAYTYNPKQLNTNNHGMIEFTISTSALNNYYLENPKQLASASIVEVGGMARPYIKVQWDSIKNSLSFKINISEFSSNGDSVTVKVPQLNLQWIQNSAIDPKSGNADKYMFSHPDSRTFLLRELMEGLQSGVYHPQGNYIFHRTVIFKREK